MQIDEHQKQFKRLRHYAAKFAYEHRHELTPISRISWADWFTKKFGMTLMEYRKWLDKEKESQGH